MERCHGRDLELVQEVDDALTVAATVDPELVLERENVIGRSIDPIGRSQIVTRPIGIQPEADLGRKVSGLIVDGHDVDHTRLTLAGAPRTGTRRPGRSPGQLGAPGEFRPGGLDGTRQVLGERGDSALAGRVGAHECGSERAIRRPGHDGHGISK